MTDIIKVGAESKMSSREIAELTGKRHDHVCRDIINLEISYTEMSLPKVGEREYTNERGQTYREFLLTKMQCFDLMTGYSAELRIKVNRRWEELESRSALPDFSNPVAAARAWADAVEQKQIAEHEAEVMKPKAEFYDQVTDSTDAIDIGSVANILNIPDMGRNKLFSFLRGKKILKDDNQPYREYIDREYFRVIEQKYSKPDGSICVSLKTVVYQKGVDYIRKLIEEEE